MTIEWCFVRDPNGQLYIIEASPELVFKGKTNWGVKSGRHGNWQRVYIDNGKLLPISDRSLVQYLDLSNVPLPEWTDEHPIVIVQNITQTYYTLD